MYGHKTTYGLISNETQYPPSNTMADMKEKMLTTGPICRYASDLRLLIEIQAGDRFASYRQNFQTKVDLKNLKYYVITGYDECMLASNISSASTNAINKASVWKYSQSIKRLIKVIFSRLFASWKRLLKSK